MSSYSEYSIPSGTVCAEVEIKKSKFIATMTGVTSKEAAVSFFQKIRNQYSGANHNCFAYIVGNPKAPEDIGLSDDGEPSGTAGKPMLSVLQHANVGNVAVIVTRFFGGVKLGKGGLVRAYSASTQMAVDNSSLKRFVQCRRIQIFFPFQFENTVRHLLATFKLDIIDSKYSDSVSVEIEVPENLLVRFQDQVNDTTKGAATFDL